MRRREYAGGIDNVFDREWYAVHGAAIASGGYFALGYARLLQRELGGDRDECVDLGVESIDSIEQSPRQFKRRQRALFDQRRCFGNRQKWQRVGLRWIRRARCGGSFHIRAHLARPRSVS